MKGKLCIVPAVVASSVLFPGSLTAQVTYDRIENLIAASPIPADHVLLRDIGTPGIDQVSVLPESHLSGRDLKIQKIADTIEKAYQEGKFSGSVTITSDRVLYQKAYGLADPDANIQNDLKTRFEIGSNSKQFTATAILLLARQGKLSVDDKLAKFFPSMPRDKQDITIRQVLSHSSGLGDLDVVPIPILQKMDPNSPDPLIDIFFKYPRVTQPGNFHYSNFGYCLLARVIERLSGSSYEDFIHENIFDPAGLKNTGYTGEQTEGNAPIAFSVGKDGDGKPMKRRADQVEYGWMGYRGADGVVINPEDLHTWLHAIFKGNFLTAEEKQLMWHPYAEVREGTWYGFGWFMSIDAKRVYHTGVSDYALFNSMIAYDADNDYFLTVMTNSPDSLDTLRILVKIFRE